MRRNRAGRWAGASAARVGHCGDASGRRVHAVDVVHAADVEDPHALGLEVGIEVDAGHPVEEHGRERRGLQRDDVRVHDALDGTCERQLRTRRWVVHPDSIQRRGSHRARRGEPVGGAGDDSRSLEQAALRPAHQQPTGTVAQRKCRLEATAWRRTRDRAHGVDGRRLLRGPGQYATIRCGRLCVLHVVRELDVEQFAAALRRDEWLGANQQVAVAHRTRIEELDRRAVRAGLVAVRAVQQLEPAAVGPHRIDAHLVVPGSAVPAREDDPAVVEHGRIEVVALVERDLLDVGAVGAHDVQHERRLVAVLVLRVELWLAFVEQDRLRLALAGRAEDHAPVGKVVWCDVVALAGDDVRADQAAQLAGRNDVFPDVPGRLVLGLCSRHERLMQREHDPRAVVGRLHVAHVALALRDAGGDVALGGRR